MLIALRFRVKQSWRNDAHDVIIVVGFCVMNFDAPAAVRSPLPPNDQDALRERLELVEQTLLTPWLHGETIDSLLQLFVSHTRISLTKRQLLRYFKLMGYRRRGVTADPQGSARIEAAVNELCPSRGQGYRALQSDLMFAFGPSFRASRQFLATLRRTSDPESTRFRFKNRMIRRVYSCNGPGDFLHMDQVLATVGTNQRNSPSPPRADVCFPSLTSPPPAE